jgi:RNA polymerase sigma-70 factor (sigma-E family)
MEVGVDATFEEFVLARGEALLRFAVMLCADRGRAEDLVQSVLARAYPRWTRILVMERPEAYVKTMLVHEHLRWWRRRSSTEVPVAEPADRDPPFVADATAEYVHRDAAWELLRRLPRKQRAVLVLRYYEDLPDAEIATILGCTRATVRSQAARAGRPAFGCTASGPGGPARPRSATPSCGRSGTMSTPVTTCAPTFPSRPAVGVTVMRANLARLRTARGCA